MRTLFVRIYLVLLLTLIGGVVATYMGTEDNYERRLAEEMAQRSARFHPTLTRELLAAEREEWEGITKRWRTVLDVEIVVAPLEELGVSAPQREMDEPLRATAAMGMDSEEAEAIWPLSDTEFAVAYRYAEVYEWTTDDLAFFVMLFAALPVALYFTLRPIARKIVDLSRVARAYAAGDLGARSLVRAPRPLAILTDDIHEMAEKLERKISEQAVMAHAISHELKTPLTRMRMANDLAIHENDPGSSQRHIEELDEDLNMLEKVVGESLELTRLVVDRGELPLEGVGLAEALRESLAEIDDGSREVELELDEDLWVAAHPAALRRVLANLLSNAARHAEGRVRVTASPRGEECALFVEDDGPGIPPESREKVFMPYGRVESSRSRRSGGTGMGLAIAALLLGKCRGRISVDESELGGARFEVVLPLGDES